MSLAASRHGPGAIGNHVTNPTLGRASGRRGDRYPKRILPPGCQDRGTGAGPDLLRLVHYGKPANRCQKISSIYAIRAHSHGPTRRCVWLVVPVFVVGVACCCVRALTVTVSCLQGRERIDSCPVRSRRSILKGRQTGRQVPLRRRVWEASGRTVSHPRWMSQRKLRETRACSGRATKRLANFR